MNDRLNSAITGRIHSVESLGSVDGPGIRFVVFMQGCSFRCQYCHNPDTWDRNGGMLRSVKDVFDEIYSLRNYFTRSDGGVTVSGGEPLLQIEFLDELFRLCKEFDIHTVIDTTGCVFNDKVKVLLEKTDLVLLDIKALNIDLHQKITGAKNHNFYKFINYLKEVKKPFWIRYVLVPGLTDDSKIIKEAADFLTQFPSLERVDVLPFHKMGEFKWDNLGLEMPLRDVKEPSPEMVEKAISIFRELGLNPNFI